MVLTGEVLLLSSSAIGRFGRLLQFIVDLIEQILGPLRMPLQIPFIRFLRGHDLLPGLFAESLRGGQIRMAGGRYIFPGSLGYSSASDQEQGTNSSS